MRPMERSLREYRLPLRREEHGGEIRRGPTALLSRLIVGVGIGVRLDWQIEIRICIKRTLKEFVDAILNEIEAALARADRATMSQKSNSTPASSETFVRNRRATRKHHAAEEKTNPANSGLLAENRGVPRPADVGTLILRSQVPPARNARPSTSLTTRSNRVSSNQSLRCRETEFSGQRQRALAAL